MVEETIIPIYGRGGETSDPRKTVPEPEPEVIPPRPIPRRTEAAQARASNNVNAFGFHNTHFSGGGFTFSAGVGPMLFPFQMQVGNNNGRPLTPEQQREMQQSRLFMLLAFFILAATIFLS